MNSYKESTIYKESLAGIQKIMITSTKSKVDKKMSVLSDRKILEKLYKHELSIEPLQLSHIQPSSIDLVLDDEILVPKPNITITFPYPEGNEIGQYFDSISISERYILTPGSFVVGQIKETLHLSGNLTGAIENRSSLIRLGINVSLSGYINPGYKGKLPIAIQNVGPFSFQLCSGFRICQLVLHEADSILKDYGNRNEAKYQGEQKITASKISNDLEFQEFKKISNQISVNEFNNFISKNIEASSKILLEQLTEEQKKDLGLA